MKILSWIFGPLVKVDIDGLLIGNFFWYHSLKKDFWNPSLPIPSEAHCFAFVSERSMPSLGIGMFILFVSKTSFSINPVVNLLRTSKSCILCHCVNINFTNKSKNSSTQACKSRVAETTGASNFSYVP